MGSLSRNDVWSLEADTAAIESQATAWQNARNAFAGVAEKIAAHVDGQQHGWDDTHAQSFFAYVPTLSAAFSMGVEHAEAAKTALQAAAEAVRECQQKLNGLLADLPGGISYSIGSGTVTFTYPDPEEGAGDESIIAAIDRAVSQAAPLRHTAEEALTRSTNTLREVAAGASSDAYSWQDVAGNGEPRWTHPSYDNSHQPVVIDLGDGQYAVAATAKDEYIRVTLDPETGEVVLTIYQLRVEERERGERHVVSIDETTAPIIHRLPQGSDVVISAGGGNDRLEVPAGTDVSLRVFGGTGDDDINIRGSGRSNSVFSGAGRDVVEAGAGTDYLSGGVDDDYIDSGDGADTVFGRGGHDSLYGVDGDDILHGGYGHDYLDGGSGEDSVIGAEGNDQVIGGRDDDRLVGGNGEDVLYGGHGADSVEGGAGADTAHTGADDSVTGASHIIVEYDPTLGQDITIEGSPEFIARVQSDLEHMRSSPAGQQQMDNVDGNIDDSEGGFDLNGRDTFVIREYQGDHHEEFEEAEGNWIFPDSPADATWDESNATGGYGGRGLFGREYRIHYNPSFHHLDPDGGGSDRGTTPPFIVFYHEYGHVNQYSSGEPPKGEYSQDNGSEVPLLERQNVGLTWDHDGNGTEEVQTAETGWDYDYTENGAREEHGIPLRTNY